MKFETDGLLDLDVPDGYDGESIFDDYDDYPIEDDDGFDEYGYYDNSHGNDYDPDHLDEEMGGYDDYDFD